MRVQVIIPYWMVKAIDDLRYGELMGCGMSVNRSHIIRDLLYNELRRGGWYSHEELMAYRDKYGNEKEDI